MKLLLIFILAWHSKFNTLSGFSMISLVIPPQSIATGSVVLALSLVLLKLSQAETLIIPWLGLGPVIGIQAKLFRLGN